MLATPTMAAGAIVCQDVEHAGGHGCARRIVPLHRGKGVGVDQGQIGTGGAQRQQLTLEPAPVHLGLG